MGNAPRIYSFSTLHGDPSLEIEPFQLDQVRSMGFDTLHGLLPKSTAAAAAAQLGLGLMADLVAKPVLAEESPDQGITGKIQALCDSGVTALRFLNVHAITAESWHPILRLSKLRNPSVWFCADALGRSLNELWALEGAGFDFVMSSVGWWDGTQPWFLEQHPIFARVGRSIGFSVTAPQASPEERLHGYSKAALLSSGIILFRGGEAGIESGVTEINRLKALIPALEEEGQLRRVTAVGSPVSGFARIPSSDNPILIAVNSLSEPGLLDLNEALAGLPPEVSDLQEIGNPSSSEPFAVLSVECGAFQVRVFECVSNLVSGAGAPSQRIAGRAPSRVVIERIQPELDGGNFPVKRVIGDTLTVSADLFRDGHEKLAGNLWLRQAGDTAWQPAPFRMDRNDRWTGSVDLSRVGKATFVIEAWTDHFGSWRDDATKKLAAGQSMGVEINEALTHIEEAIGRSSGVHRQWLEKLRDAVNEPNIEEIARCRLLLSRMAELRMAQSPDKTDAALSPERVLTVDRLRARFSSWYEMFPRSQGSDPSRSATFADCARRFPEIKEMGFDVVYFVPIHPIGQAGRKGPNNHPKAGPADPGSPYAIGSRLGGHTAIEPGLGSLADFRIMARSAAELGLELALDFAVQCAPDHPWVTEHPRWFRRRVDGSIKFAENPPKKYEDIVNVDFDQPEWELLWKELADAVKFWITEGVRIFRIDNPHTKPFAFWHWLIADVQALYPDVIFLAEAFTRPKMMLRLAKEGFTQSYSYFTWRNSKAEIMEYLTDLTGGESVEYFRPNFFPSTPDILPLYLQTGGRAAFRIRLALAATLSSNYGIYNGFELCEAGALPEKEEYRDSEKYQFKVWDWNRPGNIKDDIRKLNAIRRSCPALQRFDNLQFHPSSHPAVLFFSKSTAALRGRVLVAITLEPFNSVQTEIELPLAEWKVAGERITTEEVFSGWRQEWSGSRHFITLNPTAQPALIWKIL